MTWALDQAGPGTFTLHITMFNEPEDGVAKFAESIVLMKPVLRTAILKALDRLEHVVPGDVPQVEEPVGAATD